MIELKNLGKKFRKTIKEEGIKGAIKSIFKPKYEYVTAVDDVSLKIPDGQIVGYIGSNGAGKSTTIKMMCGILKPTSGEVLIDGINPEKRRRQIASKIGVVFGQKTQLWWEIPLIETFKVLKEIYSIPDKEYEERFAFLKETLNLESFINQPVRTLSLGQRMRGDLAAAWLHNPKILFLDEPTIGLDIWVKQKIRDAIKIMNKKYGTTVILTTHDMEDVSDLCERIILIEKGKIIYDGAIKDLKNKFGDLRTITIPFKTEFENYKFETFNNEVSYKQNEQNLMIKFNADKVKLENVIDYVFHTLHSTDLNIKELSLEDIVKKLLAKDSK